LICSELGSLRDRNELPGGGSSVSGRRADQLVVGSLLDDMGGPSTGSRNDEDWSIEVNGDPALVVSTGREEVEVSMHLLLVKHALFDVVGHIVESGISARNLFQRLLAQQL